MSVHIVVDINSILAVNLGFLTVTFFAFIICVATSGCKYICSHDMFIV
jgi:hypothetical protein